GLAVSIAWCGTARRKRAAEDQALRRHTAARTALDTSFRITLYAPDAETAAAAIAAASERLDRVDSALNGRRADSELTALNNSPDGRPLRVGDDLFAVLRQAQRFAASTRGAFDVTDGPYFELWRLAATTGRTPSQAEL